MKLKKSIVFCVILLLVFSVFSGVLGARSVNETSDEQSELESKTDDLPKNDVKDVENSKSFEDCSSVSYDPIIHHMMNKTNESKIEDNIDTLQNFENDQGTKTRRDATSGFWNSTDWVYEKFDSYGLDVFKQNFTYSGKDSTNVIAELPGTDSDVEDETYMIGAHLDSINSLGENEPAPGADDNGAGITVVLESARILSQYDFNRTIRFAAWGGEEFGLQGSDYYVSNIDPEEQDLRGYLNYDMVGYEEDGLAITHHASTPSNWMLDYKSNVTETYDIDSNFTYVYDSDTTSSDHASFWDEGYNATLSIETDFNPYYHTSDDTLDKLTIPQINETAQLAMSTAAHLAELNIEEEYPFPEEYPSIEELYDWYDDLENLYPNLVEKHKFGLSYEEKNLWALEITSDNNTQVEEKPAVLIDGGIHAREWSGPQVSSYYAWRILNEYDSNETIHWLVNNRRIFVVPMTNPDGYEFDGNGDYGERKWWRKNRNTSVGTMIDIGVDLNRNWDIKWEEGDDDPGSSTYHGESPFSENETYYLKEFILENDIDSYQNLHSYAGTLLIPWAYTNDPSPHDDWYRGMAENMTSLTSKYGDKNDHYSYGQAGEEIGYTAPGGAADWVYNETGAQGLTFEIYTGGNGFYPSEENIMTINKDLDDSLIYQTRIADTDLGDGDNESYPPVPHLIYGTVEDENNKPIKNVEVNIKSQETDENLSIPSDSNGYYELNLGNLVNEGYEIGDEFSIKVDSEIKCYFTVDDTWGQKIDLEHTETTGPFPADVPTWEIGSSWTYSQDGWYNDTDSEEYMYLEEELTYTVDDIGYYTLNETDYYGYNLSLEGGVLNGEGQIETDDFGTVEIDIDGGTVNGYMFCKMSDLGVVADDQFRDMEGTAEIAGLTVDFESWTKLTTLSNPPPEEYDFPLNTTDEKFWSNTTSYSSGYNSYVIEGFIEKNETINETVEMSSESVSPYTEEIQVPAGEFEPIYINSTQSEEDSYRDRWYEPEVKSYVKEELESPEVDWIRELESYNVSENPNNLSFDPSEQDIQENLSISGKFPDHGSEEVNIQIPEGAEPKSEWNTTLDEKGKFEKTINVPAAMDMTETNIDFSSVGFVAKIKNKSEYAVATLVIHHDNSPVYPDPKDGAENVSLDVELSTIVAHDKADKLNVTFYDASDDTIIGSEKNVSNGDYASVMWNDLKGDTTYKWYANVTAWGIDSYWESEIWIFTTLATYELSIDSEEGGEVKEPGEGDFEYQSGEVVNLEAVSDEDYYFVKWTGDNETIDDTTSNQTTIEMLDDYSITAEFEINTYELTIDSTEGGSVEQPGEGDFEYEHGKVVELEAIADEGYHFVEWTGDNQTIYDTTSNQTTIEMLDDYSITAEFEINTYELTIDSTEGGSVEQPGEGSFEYEHGKVVELEAIADEGYHFVEWTGDNETIDDPTSNHTTIEMLDDYSITAEFEINTYTLDISSTKGGNVTEPGEGSYDYKHGEIIDLKAIPNENYYFLEWTGDNQTIEDPTSNQTTIEMLDDYSITAEFSITEHELTINSTEGGQVVEPGEGTFGYQEGEIVELEAIADEGYHFVEWTGDNETIDDTTANKTTIEMLGNYTITAEFSINTYELAVDSTEGGSVEQPGEGSFEYEHGEVIELEAKAEENYHFLEWTGDIETIEDPTSNQTTIEMLEDYSITAKFEIDKYDLTIASSEGGNVEEPGEGSFEYKHGEIVDLEAIPDDGYHFVEWIGDTETIEDLKSSQTTIEMLDDYSISAEFEINTYELKVDSTEGGQVEEPGEGTFSYEHGEIVDLEAVTDNSHQFLKWTGDTGTIEDPSDNSTTITMKGDYEITAEFTDELYKLKIGSKKGGSVEEPGEGTFEYEYGEIVDLEAIADENYQFKDWTGDIENIEDPKSNQTFVKMEDDYYIRARFLEKAHFETKIISPDEGKEFEEGETLAFEYKIENTGDITDTQKIKFYLDENIVRTMEIELKGDEVHSDMVNKTVRRPFGKRNLTVESEDDSDKVTIKVVRGVETPRFKVDIFSPKNGSEFIESELITIEYMVENEGMAKNTNSIELRINGESEEKIEMTLEGDERKEGEFRWVIDKIGEHNISIASENHQDSVKILVSENAYFDVEITEPKNRYDFVVEEDITIGYRVKNKGGVKNTQNIKLYVNGTEIYSESMTLQSGETRDEELKHEIRETGEYSVKITSEDDSDKLRLIGLKRNMVSIEILEYDSDVDKNEESEIRYRVKNNEDIECTVDIEIVVHNNEGDEIYKNLETFSLDPNEVKEEKITVMMKEEGEHELSFKGDDEEEIVDTPEDLNINVEDLSDEETIPGLNISIVGLVMMAVSILYSRKREDKS